MQKLRVLDLFAGAGGLSCGFEQTSCFEIKAAVENNRDAKATYKANHISTVVYDNIKDINFKGYEFQNIDVIIGGPPCQGFSNANRNKNDLISSSNELVKEFVRSISEIRPKAFVFENVHSVVSEKHKFFLKKTDTAELEELNITPIPESIVIGKVLPFTSDLIEFINKETVESLSNYILDKKVFAKIKYIYNKQKNLSPDLFNNFLKNSINTINFIRKIINTPDNYHKYWSDSYQQLWLKLVEQLTDYIKGSITPQSVYILEAVLDVQKVIMRSKEIKEYQIEAEYRIDEKKQKLIIEVKTYNVFKYLAAKFDKLGYEIKPEILNAAEYGAAQVRRRLFILGVQKKILKGQALKFPPPKIITNEKNYFTIKDAIKDLENIEPDVTLGMDFKKSPKPASDQNRQYWNYLNSGSDKIYNHIATESTETALRRFQALKPGQNFHDLDDNYKSNYSDTSKTQNTIYKRLSYDDPSSTVLNVRKSMWIHPAKDRAISIREAARLQSFQDTYKFLGIKNSQYQQVGNAVPPILARAVAESLLDTLGINIPKRLKEILNDKEKQEPLS